jgi:pre-mRNA-splicing helicase BRR2
MGGKEIVCLTGETAADLKLLELGDVIFTTPDQWDSLSRRWKQRKNVQSVELFLADDIHLLGSEIGPTLEVVVSRMRYISVQTGSPIRIVAAGASLANARDLGEWLGCTPSNIFNFHPSARPIPLEIHIQGYGIPHFASLMLAMSKPTYTSITTLAGQEPAIVFVPSRKQSRVTALELLTFCVAEGTSSRFLHCAAEDLDQFLEHVEDKTLVSTLKSGIAFYHEGLSKNDKKVVRTLFDKGAIQVLVASRDCVWGLDLQSRLVVIMGSQYYEGKEHRYVDYPIPDVLQMMGRASRPIAGEFGKCVLMCTSNKKEFYKKFLHEALPVESHLNHYLHDHFNGEIVTKTIENKQDAVDYLTWTFMYRRMALNPNFYVLATYIGFARNNASPFIRPFVAVGGANIGRSPGKQMYSDS